VRSLRFGEVPPTGLRVAYICADQGIRVFARTGGASWHVQEFLRALLRAGARVDLFTPRPGGSPAADLGPVHLHRLERPEKMSRFEREQQALAADSELRAALESSGPYDLVYERYSLWSTAGMAYARAHRIPGLLEVNSPLVDERARYGMLFDRASAERVAGTVFASATHVLAVSEGVAGWVRRWITAAHRISVVPNGVDPDRFRGARRGTGVDGCFTIGFVGTLKPWHGLEDLIGAFALLHASDPSYRLLIVGDGPERDRLQESVRALSLEDVVLFRGAVDPVEVPDLLGRMDIAVAPYSASVDPYFSPLKHSEVGRLAPVRVVAGKEQKLPLLFDS
jgi:glycosyltransferase involved in cell wall biosynthesis